MRLRVKICCMASVGEAAIAAAAGADLVGMVGPMPSGAGVIDLETARVIAERAAPWVTPVLLTSGESAGAIAQEAAFCQVRCVQIVRHVAPEVHDELGRRLPWVRRIQAIHVEGPEALELIGRYAGRVDAFLLDSGRPGAHELGGTGRVHDWRVSAAFVRRTAVPVFLAGGLRPDNVAEAIGTVRPFGVDLCSGVRTGNRLDGAKLRAFMAACAAAAESIGVGPGAASGAAYGAAGSGRAGSGGAGSGGAGAG